MTLCKASLRICILFWLLQFMMASVESICFCSYQNCNWKIRFNRSWHDNLIFQRIWHLAWLTWLVKLLVVPNETITSTAAAWHLAVLTEVGHSFTTPLFTTTAASFLMTVRRNNENCRALQSTNVETSLLRKAQKPTTRPGKSCFIFICALLLWHLTCNSEKRRLN